MIRTDRIASPYSASPAPWGDMQALLAAEPAPAAAPPPKWGPLESPASSSPPLLKPKPAAWASAAAAGPRSAAQPWASAGPEAGSFADTQPDYWPSPSQRARPEKTSRLGAIKSSLSDALDWFTIGLTQNGYS
jgi:hypothetical protein